MFVQKVLGCYFTPVFSVHATFLRGLIKFPSNPTRGQRILKRVWMVTEGLGLWDAECWTEQ